MSTEEYILIDTAGFASRLRYTHYPSGKTLVRQPYYNHNENGWLKDINSYFDDIIAAHGDDLTDALSMPVYLEQNKDKVKISDLETFLEGLAISND